MTSNNLYSLVLASQSPRRKELLEWIDIPFEIHSEDIEEVSDLVHSQEICEDIAKQKGVAVYRTLESNIEFGNTYFPLVVSSDTMVCLGDKIYGKPKDVNGARKMLLELSGQSHEVITSVYICFKDKKTGELKEVVFSGKTQVTFENIDEDILELYLASGDSLDKAGSYGIQGQGLSFISKVEGSYSNVVGFPLSDFISELKDILGYSKNTKGEWRSEFHA